MCFPACNVAHAQEAVRLDGIPDSIPEEFSGMRARTGRKSSQMMHCGSVPHATPARSVAHVGYQSQTLFLSSGDLQLEKVSCFRNTGRFRKRCWSVDTQFLLTKKQRKRGKSWGLSPYLRLYRSIPVSYTHLRAHETD